MCIRSVAEHSRPPRGRLEFARIGVNLQDAFLEMVVQHPVSRRNAFSMSRL